MPGCRPPRRSWPGRPTQPPRSAWPTSPAASSRADRRMSSWSPAIRSPTSRCSAILSTSSRPVGASSAAARSEPMTVGLLLPQGYFNEFEGWRPGDAWDRILQIARLGERLGFDSLWTGEHVLAKWDPEGPAFDCVTIQHGGRRGRPARRYRLLRHQLDVPQPGHDREDGRRRWTRSAAVASSLGSAPGSRPTRPAAFGHPYRGAQGAPGDPVRALRDREPDDPSRRAALHLRGRPRARSRTSRTLHGPAVAITSGCWSAATAGT